MSPKTRFDPYAILAELDRERTFYVVIGALARVIHGSDEVTRGLDLCPSPTQENLRTIGDALERLHARRVDGKPLELDALDSEREPALVLESDAGEIKLVLEPTGTRGYDDLRRRANREPLGQGLRPSVAAPGDLVRMLEALERQPDPLVLETMRRVLELDRGRVLER